MEEMQPLLTPYACGNFSVSNRVVMAPLTRCRARNEAHVPTELHVEYYSQRAEAGLIITEGAQVSPRAVGYIGTPGIYSAEQVRAWRKVTEAVHAKEGRIFIQLWHVGRNSHCNFLDGQLPLAPSAESANLLMRDATGEKKITPVPQAMTKADIAQTQNDFVQAAKNAMEAGFDGVEIHSSNGYLFHQFFAGCANHRTDEYGGSVENRTRFFFETLEKILEQLPAHKVAARFNPSANNIFGIVADELTIPTFEYLIQKLHNYSLGYLHLSEPFNDVSNVPFVVENVAAHFRPLYEGTLMINSKFDREKGNAVIEAGLADLVSFGKLFISNPNLPAKFRANKPLTPWDVETFYSSGPVGYTDYPVIK